jgi:AmmeMemoRadiSam system protein A
MNPENPSVQQLSAEEGHLLLDLARQTIAAELGIIRVRPADFDMHASVLTMRRGTFVTLKKAGDLRGCIGTLTADQSLGDNIRTNAINAAFHDPRFPPLTAGEWPRIKIEVSILSPPRKLDYASGAELPGRLTPHEDGVVIRKGYASATFLPQVWKQLSRPQDFLAHLCLKAGLAADAWRQGDLEVERYQVQYFAE